MSTKSAFTDKDIISLFAEDGYDAFNSKRGASDKLKGYLESHLMKTSTGTNAEKWARIVRDCVPDELKGIFFSQSALQGRPSRLVYPFYSAVVLDLRGVQATKAQS